MALVPQMQGRSRPEMDTGAVAAISVPKWTDHVSVVADGEGSIRVLGIERWGGPEGSFVLHTFGGTVEHGSFEGAAIATTGRIGRHTGPRRPADGALSLDPIASAHLPALP